MATNEGERRRVRKRNWTSADRAAHRVFEKSRREAFNDGMVELARQIPSLNGTRRLNKHMIVEHSIARHQSQRDLCLAAISELRNLMAERDELLAEINQWRASCPLPIVSREAAPSGPRLQEVLDCEHETFSTFPNSFGDNPPEDYPPDELSNEYALEETWTGLPLTSQSYHDPGAASAAPLESGDHLLHHFNGLLDTTTIYNDRTPLDSGVSVDFQPKSGLEHASHPIIPSRDVDIASRISPGVGYRGSNNEIPLFTLDDAFYDLVDTKNSLTPHHFASRGVQALP